MDKAFVRQFWQARAQHGTTRWTGPEMLAFETAMLRRLVPTQASVLDLGSGFGELVRGACGADVAIVAVDAEPAMAEGFAPDPRCRFINADVTTFTTTERFDLVLLFGVVTHLSVEDEQAVYAKIASFLTAGGIATVKNQCSDGDEFEVDGLSDALAQRYIGRYPARNEQRARLLHRFDAVSVVRYPADLKVHEESSHVAFVCRGPKSTAGR